MALQQSETADTIIGYSLLLNCPKNKIGFDYLMIQKIPEIPATVHRQYFVELDLEMKTNSFATVVSIN